MPNKTVQAVRELQREVEDLWKQRKYDQAMKLAHHMCELARGLGESHPDFAVALASLGSLYRDKKEYPEAESYLLQALTANQKSSAVNGPLTAQIMTLLGLVYSQEGKYFAAEPILRHASQINRKLSGPNHSEVATSLDNLAALYTEMGKYKEAEVCFQQAGQIWRANVGNEHSDLAINLDNFGMLYWRMGKYAAAEPLLLEANEIFRKSAGKQHPDFLTNLGNLAMLYKATGRYAEAEAVYRRVLTIDEAVLGPNDPAVARNLNNLAQLYFTQQRYREAEPLFLRCLEIRSTALGQKHPLFAQTLNNLARVYDEEGKYKEAEQLLVRAADIRAETLGKSHPDFAQSLGELAKIFTRKGEYAKAEQLYERALTILHEGTGTDNPEGANLMSGLGMVYQADGRYAEAERLYNSVIKIRKDTVGEKHHAYSVGVRNLAGLYKTMANFTGAERLLRQSLDIDRVALGENSPGYWSGLIQLGELYLGEHKYKEAEPLFLRCLDINPGIPEHYDSALRCLAGLVDVYRAEAKYELATKCCKESLEIRREQKGEAHPDFARTLNQLATLYDAVGNYATAEPLLQQALEIMRAALGEEHIDVAGVTCNIAHLYREIGRYTLAESHYEKARNVLQKTLGDGHPQFADCLNGIASLCEEMGKYGEAQRLFRQALQIRSRAFGSNHPAVAQSWDNLASLYGTLGKFERAKELHILASEIWRATLGDNSPDLAINLDGVAATYCRSGQYKAAEVMIRQAIAIFTSVYGEDHPHLAVALGNLAFVKQQLGEYAESKRLEERHMEIVRKYFGEAHANFARALLDHGYLHWVMGEYSAAEPLLSRGVDIASSALADFHPLLSDGLHTLASVYVAQGRFNEAMLSFDQAIAIDDRLVGQLFSAVSDSTRMAFLETVRGNYEVFLSFLLQYGSQDRKMVGKAFDMVLRRKAILAESLAIQRDAISSGRYPQLEPKLRRLIELRMQIAQMTLAGSVGEKSYAQLEQLFSLIGEKEILETELVSDIPEMNLSKRVRRADHRAVALALPQGSALIEFAKLRPINFDAVQARGEQRWGLAHYVAFVAGADAPDNPRVIDLGETEQIDRILATFRSSITGEHERELTTEPERLCEDSGLKLRELLFDPLKPFLGSRTQLLVAPDANLNRLPFEVMPTIDGRQLIDDYRISYVSVGRDALRFVSTKNAKHTQPIVIADPDFDLANQLPILPGATRDEFAQNASSSTVASTPDPLPELEDLKVPGSQEDASYADFSEFDPLPGTQKEGQWVADALGVQCWRGGDALEGKLRACHSPWILHLATHGFFLPDQKKDPDREFVKGRRLASALNGNRFFKGVLQNPLLRSGVALAGANTWLKGGASAADAQDGLLTAEDVSGLDLLGTELVVLSACETGLGEIQSGEGVFGLRRAFVVAGAKTLVMSLWKVPDEQTGELMQKFYRRVLSGGSRSEALRGAQLEMRSKYPDPGYWGAFICQGDFGPLLREDEPTLIAQG